MGARRCKATGKDGRWSVVVMKLVMCCRGNVGAVSRRVVESQDGLVCRARAGGDVWVDRERVGMFGGSVGARVARAKCMSGVVNGREEDEQDGEAEVVVVAGYVRRFGRLDDEVLAASEPVCLRSATGTTRMTELVSSLPAATARSPAPSEAVLLRPRGHHSSTGLL